MISLSDEALSVLTGTYTYHIAVESWLDDQLLADVIPVSSGSEETDRSLTVPESITLTVPRVYGGVSWSPAERDHPLAAHGQRLRVQLGIGLQGGTVEWIQRGWFLVRDSRAQGDSVMVRAVGLLALIEEARLVSPYQPTGTLVSTLRGLVEPALTVVVDSALTDRAVPSGVNYDEDRLGAVLELIDAWPAEAHVTEDGYLSVRPVQSSATPVLSLTNGAGGTIITATGDSTREGALNAVVARGTAADGAQVQGVAYDNSGGPMRYGGPFNPLPVPFFFQSPLLTSTPQCESAAQTVLARKRRESALRFTAEMVPHPALQAGDVVSVTTEDHDNLLCTIEALTLPYTADGGAQSLTLRSLE
jgi:Domain of unknown function (DUF5047)